MKLRAIGLLPIVVCGAAAVAAVVQLTTGLPRQYSWDFSLRLFQDIVREPWFPTVALLCFTIGRTGREPRLLDELHRTAARRVCGHVSLGLVSIAIGAACAVMMLRLNTGYTPWDALAIGIFASLVILLPPTPSRLASRSVEILVIFALYTLASYAHTVGKAMIFVASDPQDKTILGWESALFGQPVHRYVVSIFAEDPAIIKVASELYRWNASQILLVSILLTGADLADDRREFLCSIGLGLLLAAPLYHLVPSMGPYFADHASYTFLDGLDLSANWYKWLQSNTSAVVQGNARQLETFQYIAAMPSLHVGFSFTMLYYARRSRIAFAIATPIMMFAWLATMLLGWHYFLDGVFGIVVAFGAVGIARSARNWLLPARVQSAASMRTRISRET